MRVSAFILSFFYALVALFTTAAADPGDNPAIFTVVDSYTNYQELAYTFGTLSRATAYPDAPVFVFHGVPLSAQSQAILSAATPRSVTFVDVCSFYADIPSVAARIAGDDADYQQKQRFLISHVWYEPVLEPYNVLMRITDTTCITMDTDYLPGFPPSEKTLNYKSYSIPNDLELTKYTVGLYAVTLKFISDTGHAPENIELWAQVVNSHDHENKIPKFSDDFEIVRKSWITSPEIQAYHEHLADRATVRDLFERKWPASVVMFITAALFSEDDATSTMHLPGVVEKDLWAGNYFPNLCRIA